MIVFSVSNIKLLVQFHLEILKVCYILSMRLNAKINYNYYLVQQKNYVCKEYCEFGQRF